MGAVLASVCVPTQIPAKNKIAILHNAHVKATSLLSFSLKSNWWSNEEPAISAPPVPLKGDIDKCSAFEVSGGGVGAADNDFTDCVN